jgi:hypothetical protein
MDRLRRFVPSADVYFDAYAFASSLSFANARRLDFSAQIFQMTPAMLHQPPRRFAVRMSWYRAARFSKSVRMSDHYATSKDHGSDRLDEPKHEQWLLARTAGSSPNADGAPQDEQNFRSVNSAPHR